jgi:outer membrane cobalamin receptor
MNKIAALFMFLLLACWAHNSWAQVSVSGYVSDRTSNERLIGATIYDALSGKGTTTNAFGFFSLKTEQGKSLELAVSYVGYKPAQCMLVSTTDTLIHLYLIPGKELGEVTVKAQNNRISNSDMGMVSLPMKLIEKLPALGGEVDLIKAMQLLPGVKSGNEGTSGLYVRGGSPDQNLVMIDDVPLYYVNHLGGFVSIFNPDIINHVNLVKGSFPARYGSRLSSVVDVRMKDGNMKTRQGNATIGMITSKVSIEGPIKVDTSSYVLSVRRFMYDILMVPFTKIIQKGASLGYTFYDINGKFNHIFSESDRIYFSVYNGRDKVQARMKNRKAAGKFNNSYDWGNLATSMRWNHVYGPRLFSNVTASFTQYHYDIDDRFEMSETETSKALSTRYHFRSQITDVALKADFDQTLSSNYHIRYGAGGTYHSFLPSQSYLKKEDNALKSDSTFGIGRLAAVETFAYIENQLQVSEHIHANLGLRYTNYWVEQKGFHNLEPRATISAQLPKGYALKAGYTRMAQYVHLLSGNGVGMQADYWVPATKKLVPSTAHQVGITVEQKVPQSHYSWSIEPYWKRMNNLITFREGIANLQNTADWESRVEANGVGDSYGIELFLQWEKGPNSGWAGYTLSKTTRQFPNINAGQSYPFRYDRRHDISLVYTRQIRDNIDFSATWVFGTGNAFTLATGHHLAIQEDGSWERNYEDILITGEVYSTKNAYRMRPYHRMDVGLNIRKMREKGERVWNFSIYNLYNRQNPYFYYWDTPRTAEGSTTISGMKLFQYSYFPVMPSVSYSFRF